jgi:hypothetical protein
MRPNTLTVDRLAICLVWLPDTRQLSAHRDTLLVNKPVLFQACRPDTRQPWTHLDTRQLLARQDTLLVNKSSPPGHTPAICQLSARRDTLLVEEFLL